MFEIKERSLAKAKVLVVDDNDLNLSFLSEFIKMIGCNVISASNGMEAIDVAHSQDLDLMLLDIIMPEMDGFEVLRKLKEVGLLDKFPVIIVSADENINNIVKCIEMGADDYLIKPFHSVILKARIKNSLEKKFRQDQEEVLLENLRQSHEELKTLEQARDSLSHIIVHDLNNPLSTIKGYTQYLSMKSETTTVPKEDIIKNLRKVSASVDDMESLIKGILDVSKLESDKMHIINKEFDAIEMSKNIYDDFLIRLDQSRECVFLPMEKSLNIYADRNLLSRVIQNLLTNAFKHTAKNAKISFLVKSEGDNIIFIIEDTGYGIPEKVKTCIFDKFVQLENKKVGKKYGVGLGLYFCKMAMDAMEGTIEVESEEGKGTSFFVKLRKGKNG